VLIVMCSLPHIVWQWGYHQATANSLQVRTPESRRLWYFRDAALAPEPARDVRLYGLAAFFGQRYKAVFRRAVDAMAPRYRALTARSALGMALGALAVGAVYVFVIWQVIVQGAAGRLTVGDVALFGGAAAMLHDRLLDIGWAVSVVPRDLAFLPALNRVLHAPPDLPVPAHPLPAPCPIREGIVFDNVWFAYPAGPDGRRAANPPVLRGVSFAIRPGESLALVGLNGAGKTTIVKLLLRFYDPHCPRCPTDPPGPPGPARPFGAPGPTQPPGRITLDGVDLREYDLESLRRRMGVIFQDFVRYELTVRENVAIGDLSALGDDARLLAAARRAGADALIRDLPGGLDTQLGRRFGGRDLSGGEWQKLALARAFVRDCDLLVLDEPTAALDVQTEYDVYLRFQELTRGRMTLLISHRFSTVRMADRILYVDGGRVAEEGSHRALLRADGEYARLYRLQASRYLDAAPATGEAGGRREAKEVRV
jgi:ATP-binding cassette subfamily B protein